MIPKELQNMKPLEGSESLPRDADYLGAIDFIPGTEPVLTIGNLYNGEITLSQGKQKKKVITFVEERVPGINEVRPLVLNRTNWKTLKKLFGDMTASTLKGKRIQLYLQSGVRNPGTKEVGSGIRIRETIPAAGAKYQPPVCEECGKEIVGMTGFSPEQVATINKKRYGKCLCVECGKKAKEALMTQSNSAQTPQTEGVQTARNDGAGTAKTSAAQAAAEKNEAKAKEEAIVHTEEPIRSVPGGTKEGQAESAQMSLAERLAAEMEVQ